MAISAPTPISSLVHSSTLVTAGIFIIIKINFLFYIFEIQFILIFFGLLTFFLGGLFSLIILDLKKTVAFSTLSQIGFIIFSLSLGNWIISYYHLLYHAFFKSLLFINLGLIIIKNFSLQEFRLINNFYINNFFKFCLFFSLLNLIGFFFSIGFISKDFIMIIFFNNLSKLIILIIFFIRCILTIFYSIKIILLFNYKKIIFFSIQFSKKISLINLNLFIILILIIFFPNIVFDILNLDIDLNLTRIKKVFIYCILIFIIIIFKIIFFCKKIFVLFFSSMLIILDYLNFFIIEILLKLNKLNIIINILEDYFQLDIFKSIINSKIFTNLSWNNINIIFLNIILFFVT